MEKGKRVTEGIGNKHPMSRSSTVLARTVKFLRFVGYRIHMMVREGKSKTKCKTAEWKKTVAFANDTEIELTKICFVNPDKSRKLIT